jgi:tRNA nucleotidyltransferase (CCA-adding enzyme)
MCARAMPGAEKPIESFVAELRRTHPELEAVREAASEPVYVVGGAVRDLLLGRDRADLDLAVEGEAAALAARLGAEPVEHERFGTAKVMFDGHEVDIASARSEAYAEPGALPDVTVPASIEADLGRRDFTINAMAIPLEGEPRLIDSYGGRADLEAGLLRTLHARSFVDDPTRAIRAARYAARFGFQLEPETERLLRAADLSTVSADRREAELLRLAGEPSAQRGLELLAGWGLVAPQDGGMELVRKASELLDAQPWGELAPRAQALLAAAIGPEGGERELAEAAPERPSQGVELARRRDPIELVLARALGADWLDRYVGEWRQVRLEIDGADLIAAGIPEGPALGEGLKAALRAKLDGEVDSRNEELAVALEAAQGA